MLNLQIKLGRTDILTALTPISERGISHNLYLYFCFLAYYFLKIFLCRPCTYFFRFILTYFIFCANVNDVGFLISKSSCSLMACRKQHPYIILYLVAYKLAIIQQQYMFSFSFLLIHWREIYFHKDFSIQDSVNSLIPFLPFCTLQDIFDKM